MYPSFLLTDEEKGIAMEGGRLLPKIEAIATTRAKALGHTALALLAAEAGINIVDAMTSARSRHGEIVEYELARIALSTYRDFIGARAPEPEQNNKHRQRPLIDRLTTAGRYVAGLPWELARKDADEARASFAHIEAARGEGL